MKSWRKNSPGVGLGRSKKIKDLIEGHTMIKTLHELGQNLIDRFEPVTILSRYESKKKGVTNEAV